MVVDRIKNSKDIPTGILELRKYQYSEDIGIATSDEKRFVSNSYPYRLHF